MARKIGSRYTANQILGRGSAGTVWLGEGPEGPVAIKLLREDLASDQELVGRFVQERTALLGLEHPNVVSVRDLVVDGNDLALVMDLVRGTDLRTRLERERRLAPEAAVAIVADVADGLAAAHAAGVVHRDVKPGNILIARGTDSEHPEHAYLTDFGLTKKSLSLTGFTTVGQFVGTLDYVAPEQISGRPVDGRCDVYGLACVVYETLAGRPPFLRDDDMALLWAHQHDTPPALTESRPDLAPRVDGVFARALAKSPDARHDSCRAFVVALRVALSGQSAQATPADTGHPPTLADASAAPGARERPGAPPRWAEPVFGPGPRA
ncbi:serine/threonine-protein kinase [Streptomyces glaucescens]|uniref:serine/threonine-protein kinase n=1 Tax=Streptomyces glaucescens TaxID=1907 RepID=UPI000A3AEA26|nr:serine/threonine-protein kinase [Streptomyces glaucescens]